MSGLKVNLGDDIQLLFPIQFNVVFFNCRQCLTNFHIRNLCTKIMLVGLPANFCYIMLSFVVYIEVSLYCLCTVLTRFIYKYVPVYAHCELMFMYLVVPIYAYLGTLWSLLCTLWSLLCTLWSLFMYLVVPIMYLVVPIYVLCGPYLCTL